MHLLLKDRRGIFGPGALVLSLTESESAPLEKLVRVKMNGNITNIMISDIFCRAISSLDITW